MYYYLQKMFDATVECSNGNRPQKHPSLDDCGGGCSARNHWRGVCHAELLRHMYGKGARTMAHWRDK